MRRNIHKKGSLQGVFLENLHLSPDVITKQTHTQRVSLGLLQWAMRNKQVSTIKHFLRLRILAVKRKDAHVPYKEVIQFMTRYQIYAIRRLGLIKKDNKGLLWLVNQERVLKMLGIDDFRFVKLDHDSLYKLKQRTIEVTAYDFQRRKTYNNRRSTCDGSQQMRSKVVGLSVRLLAEILGVSPSTVQKHKGDMWTPGKYVRSNIDYLFISKTGIRIRREPDSFFGWFDIYYAPKEVKVLSS